MLNPAPDPLPAYKCSLHYVWKGLELEMKEREREAGKTPQRGNKGVALALPFALLLLIGVLLGAFGPRLTRIVSTYGTVEAAITLGALISGAVMCAPFFFAWKLYRYVGYLCKKGWEAEILALKPSSLPVARKA